jgi:hypothetical protein
MSQMRRLQPLSAKEQILTRKLSFSLCSAVANPSGAYYEVVGKPG